MAIPQPIDFRLAEVENAAASVMATLRILRFSGGSRDIRPLRERLQAFVNLTMEVAHEIVDADVER
jgi:hypothetical protein